MPQQRLQPGRLRENRTASDREFRKLRNQGVRPVRSQTLLNLSEFFPDVLLLVVSQACELAIDFGEAAISFVAGEVRLIG